MTKIFAHRGASGTFPENTMEAFKQAAAIGADGIELDVQMAKDGRLVIIHDEKLDRTTSLKGYVKDLTYAEIKRGDASHRFSEKPALSRYRPLKKCLSGRQMLNFFSMWN